MSGESEVNAWACWGQLIGFVQVVELLGIQISKIVEGHNEFGLSATIFS